jgi:hypothetical protein
VGLLTDFRGFVGILVIFLRGNFFTVVTSQLQTLVLVLTNQG